MELERADFDLPAAIDNALTLVREHASRRGITLGRTIDDRVGVIRADERKVKQVLLNLLSNAIKFTPEGGRIDLRAALNEDLVEVSVADTGVGIAPEDHAAVFEEPSGGGGGQEGGGHRARAGSVSKVRRPAWGPNLGHESGGRWFDLHVHIAGAARQVSPGESLPIAHNSTLDRTAGSHSLAAAGQRGRSPHR
jgi:hypothetical protein